MFLTHAVISCWRKKNVLSARRGSAYMTSVKHILCPPTSQPSLASASLFPFSVFVSLVVYCVFLQNSVVNSDTTTTTFICARSYILYIEKRERNRGMIESAFMLFNSCILNVLGVVHSYLAPVVTCGYLSLSEMFF